MKLVNKLTLFFCLIIFFTILYYKSNNNLDFSESLVLSVSFQTFNGSNVLEFNDFLKYVSIIQMISSYILIVIILYGFSK